MGKSTKATKRRSRKKPVSKETQLRHWLIQKIRRISYQWPPRKEVKQKARVSRGKYRCALCAGENFAPKDIQLDHVEPVIDPHKGFIDWNEYINRLFVPAEGWQLLCRLCHTVKTNLENDIRKQVKSKPDPEEEI